MKREHSQITRRAEETQELAAKFAQGLPEKAVVGLIGELGSGKTTFVQGMAQGLSIPKENYITSPTFTILQEYPGGRLTLYHFDLYRLERFQELMDIGFEDSIQDTAISVIEWADRFDGLDRYLTHRVKLEITGENTRRIWLSLAGGAK